MLITDGIYARWCAEKDVGSDRMYFDVRPMKKYIGQSTVVPKFARCVESE